MVDRRALLIAVAAPLSFTHRSQRRRAYSSSMVFPSIFAAIAVGVMTWDHFSRLHEVSVWLSAATLAAVIVRMGISFRENTALMDALHDDAATDSLTELGNRRKLVQDLQSALALGQDAQHSHVFALYDLDGFKFYNDSFGHPAGDSLLRRLGGKLAEAVEPTGRAYRLGGDEFCILVSASAGRMASIVEAGRAALTEHGEGFRVSASAGAVLLSAEATIASEALRLADRRMYSEKSERSGRVDRRSHELLVTIMREREPELTDHHEDVSRLAVAVGRELEFDAEEIDVLRRAAEFHDIGKIAIPDEILHKPGPLDEGEWELMRKHTLVGRADHRHLPVDGASGPSRPVLARALGRRGLSGWPRRRGDPARGPGHRRLRRVRRDAKRAALLDPARSAKARSPSSAAERAPSSIPRGRGLLRSGHAGRARAASGGPWHRDRLTPPELKPAPPRSRISLRSMKRTAKRHETSANAIRNARCPTSAQPSRPNTASRTSSTQWYSGLRCPSTCGQGGQPVEREEGARNEEHRR